MASYQQTLCKFAIGDDSFIENALEGVDERGLRPAGLDRKTNALVRLAALIAADAASPSYLWPVEEALRAGASEDEIVGCLVAVLPAVGAARVVSAAPKLGLALGFDVNAALEDAGPPALPTA